MAGLFIYSLCIIQLGWERSGLAASLALSVSMIPVVTTTAEVVLRLVPNGLREASLALGTTQWQTVRRVVLPTARPGLVTAVLLGVARVIGETSPVLLVAGSTNELNYDPTHGPQLSLPLFVFTGMRQPLDVAIQRAFGAGVVLLVLVVVFFALARIVGGREPGHLSGRQRRRLAAAAASRGENRMIAVRRIVAVVAATMAAGLVLVPAPAAQADTYVPISGAGSTWSQVAVDAWRADIRASGVVVNFAGTGSTDGRSQFIQATVDFANTEIPFQNPPEPGQQAESPSRDYAYLPIVAGGTSFMYNLTVGGAAGPRPAALGEHAVEDLHRRDHPLERPGDHRRLRQAAPRHPDHPRRPLRRRRRLGAVHQVHGQPGALDLLPLHPRQAAPQQRLPERLLLPGLRELEGPGRARTASPTTSRRRTAPGSIGYVEYAYAKRINFPVIGLLNKAGYYAQPTAGNVAVALTKAADQPRPDPEPRVGLHQPGPAGLPDVELQLHGHPDVDGLAVQHRQGQDALDVHQLLPVPGPAEGRHPRLLTAAQEPRARRLRPGQADPGRGRVAGASTSCNNPALDILNSAPQPDPCTKQGATGCGTGASTNGAGASNGNGNGNGNGGKGGGTTTASGTTDGATTTDATGGAGTTDPGTVDPLGGAAAPTAADPLAGGAAVDPAAADTGGGAALAAAPGAVVQLTGGRDGQGSAAAWIGVVALALTVLTPPFLLQRHRRRR